METPQKQLTIAIEVSCTTSETRQRIPFCINIRGKQINVKKIIDSWPGKDHEYYKIRSEDNDVYIIRFDIPLDRWELIFFTTDTPDINHDA